MTEFLEFLSTNELTIVVSLMLAVFILIMTIIIIDLISKRKTTKKEDLEEVFDTNDNLDKTNIKVNTDGLGMVADETALDKIDVEKVTKNLEKTQEIEEIKYVEEDEELERTKALLELETIKKELAKMEQEKELEPVKPVADEVKIEDKKNEIINDAVDKVKVGEEEIIEPILEKPVVEETKTTTNIEEEVDTFETEQEEHAIISVEELMKASENITEEEIEQYEDDGNEPISIKELEALYKSIEEPIKVEVKEEKQEKTTLPDFDLKVKPTSVAYEGKEFKNSSVISPVFGLKTTEESIMLEQTANLDKLNEEIRKTNEFLSALKELRKNLE